MLSFDEHRLQYKYTMKIIVSFCTNIQQNLIFGLYSSIAKEGLILIMLEIKGTAFKMKELSQL